METDLQNAVAQLRNGDYTCVLCKDNTVYHSTQRGVRPLLNWLDNATDLMGFFAADKVVGRGAAFLYRLLGVRRVHGNIMSVAAVKVLRTGGIEATWDILAESIRNRQGDGPCPMESATQDCTEPDEALAAIRSTLAKLS